MKTVYVKNRGAAKCETAMLSLRNEADARDFSLDATESIDKKHLVPKLILIRGMPGSGKSTTANVLALLGYVHFEADMYFCESGKYKYDAKKVVQAHEWCKQQTRSALAMGKKVVVSNTFIKTNELSDYLSMTDSVKIVEARGSWQNTYNVSEEKISLIKSRWEDVPGTIPLIHPTQGGGEKWTN